jgi:hypothetical protein
MNGFQFAWEWLLPATEDVLLRGQAGLVIAACLGLALAAFALVLTWAVTGDLERRTVVGAVVLTLMLTGIGSLARGGRVLLAAGALIALLTLIITAVVTTYGLASVGASAYVLPIALAACALGLGAGLGVAGVSAAIAWLLAWGERAGWRKPLLQTHVYHLTFNAPVLTVLFLLTALVTGVRSRYLVHMSAP